MSILPLSQPLNPLLLNFPDHFTTERLLIRAPHPGDGATVNEAVRESFDELRPWMPWAQEIPPVESTEEFARRGAAGWLLRDNLPMWLFLKSDGRFVGGSGLHNVNWAVPSFEIGYWVRTSLAGNGYITEAVLRITTFALEELGSQRIEIRCDPRNTRSAAVAERAGYTLEAHFRNHMRAPDGGLRGTLVFARYPES